MERQSTIEGLQRHAPVYCGSIIVHRIELMHRPALLIGLFFMLMVGCSSDRAGLESVTDDSQKRGIVMIRYVPGSESTEQREAGFLETMESEFADLPIISSNQYAGTTAETALEKSQQVLLRLGDRSTGIFCPNESSADGMFRAMDEAGLLGKVPFVGFDPNPRMVGALNEGKMHGIVLQDPVEWPAQQQDVWSEHLSKTFARSATDTIEAWPGVASIGTLGGVATQHLHPYQTKLDSAGAGEF